MEKFVAFAWHVNSINQSTEGFSFRNVSWGAYVKSIDDKYTCQMQKKNGIRYYISIFKGIRWKLN